MIAAENSRDCWRVVPHSRGCVREYQELVWASSPREINLFELSTSCLLSGKSAEGKAQFQFIGLLVLTLK